MKKIMLFMIGILLFMIIPFKVHADNSLPNWEFLPNGYNYLEDENFDYTVGNPINYGTITCLNYIRIKPGVTYMLTIYAYQEAEILAVRTKAYNASKQLISTLQPTVVNHGEDKYYQITPPSNAKYIDLEFDVMEDYGANLGLYEIENNFCLIESMDYTTYSNLSALQLRYQGPILDYSPVISNYHGLYITNCDNPVSMATITSAIKAMDDNDGDITSQITITKNEYSSNMHTIGQYEIIYSVVDSSGNTAQLSVFIWVKDTTSPVINGEDSYTTNQYTPLLATEIKEELSATDNYDGNLTSYITIKSDTYTGNEATPGTYTITYTVTDSSNNSCDYPVTVLVNYEDNIAPVFTGTFSYEIANNQKLTLQDILKNIVVEDNDDGIITSQVTIEYDYYSHAPTRVGTFKIGLIVNDNRMNTARKEITVVVTDETSPIFMIDMQIINIDISDNNMEISDFVSFLERTQTVKQNLSYSVIEDEYSENKNTPGTYKVVLDVEGEELELQVNVFEELDQELAKIDLIDLIVNFFVDLWSKITAFFKRIF